MRENLSDIFGSNFELCSVRFKSSQVDSICLDKNIFEFIHKMCVTRSDGFSTDNFD